MDEEGTMNNVIIIAEAGVNHNGSIDLAKELVNAASQARVDFVKFQSFKAEKLVKKDAEKAAYQKEASTKPETQYEMLKRLELSWPQHLEIIDYCKTKNVHFLSTPFDEESATFLAPYVPLFKVSSTDLNNFSFLKHLCQFKKPIIISTGMSDLLEIEISIKYINKCWNEIGFNSQESTLYHNLKIPNLTVLHCTTAYPTPFNEANLLAMKTIEQKLKVTVGYSDHTLGTEASIAATALGAQVIEKHYTLDVNLEGPDHKASLPKEKLQEFVSGIRNVFVALGDGKKVVTATESMNKKVARKGLYYSSDLSLDSEIKEDHIQFLRPTHEVGPEYFFNLLGKKLKKSVKQGSPIKIEDFQ